MAGRFEGTRVLITDANRYMGPPIGERFVNEGADVITCTADLSRAGQAEDAIAEAGVIDVLIANLAEPEQHFALAQDIEDDHWKGYFDYLVHPLMRLVRAALPQMIERKRGKIVAVTSAAPLRGIPKASAYCAARGAQNAFIRAVGLEVARNNVQVNAIAQNYVENSTYFPDEMLADEAMMKRILGVIPAKRLGKGWETAELALFLASENSDFMVGQIFPFAGGWVTSTG